MEGFAENCGQWDGKARFLLRKGGMACVLESGGLQFQLARAPLQHVTLRLIFEDASQGARLVGEGKRTGLYNFFVGNDPARWRSEVPAYECARYVGLYEGVDVRIREEASRLEYDLFLAPGADLDRVSFRCEGATPRQLGGLELLKDGTLILETAGGFLRQMAPKTWEVLPSGENREVACRFRKIDRERYGFSAPEHDQSLPLVIDPGLEWSTFLGGSSGDQIQAVQPARDGTGDVFVAGYTGSPDFPLLSDPDFTPSQDLVFVARMSSLGTTLVHATFLGGWHSQIIYRGLAVDALGSAVLVGETTSPDFPTTPGALDLTLNGTDAFVVRLSSTGGLVFSTFLGGAGFDSAAAVGLDPAGSIIVGGTTTSPDFPTTVGAFDTTYNTPNAPSQGGADGDVFITRLSADGRLLTYSTFIGGPSEDVLEDVAVDPQGFVMLVGWMTGNLVQVFPTTPDAFDRTWNGSQDAVLARLHLDGAGSADLKYATILGGANQDNAFGVAVDPTNPELVVVVGGSWSDDFPTTLGALKRTNPPFSPLFPAENGFISKFRFPAAGANSLVWSTYFGGTDFASEAVSDGVINGLGEVIVSGRSRSFDFPTTRGAFDRTHAGTRNNASDDGFVSRLSADGAQILYSTFFGGSDGDEDNFRISPQLAYVTGNTVLVAGSTASSDFPITPGVLDGTFGNPEGGTADGYVMRLSLDPDASGDVTVNAPALLSPLNGASTSASGLARLEWTDVLDPSGIEAYSYQVSSKPDFPAGFVQYRGSVSGTEVILPPAGIGEGGLAIISWFWRVQAADRAGNLSAWSTPSAFSLGVAGARPGVSFVQTYPSSVTGGNSAQGVLHLNDSAPAGGMVATFSVHDSRGLTFTESRSVPLPVTIPQTLNVPAGAITVPFPIGTGPVSESTPVNIIITLGGVGQPGSLSLNPPPALKPSALVISPASVTGGTGSLGTVSLPEPAPASGLLVNLASSHPQAARVPPTVTVPAGASSATFAITTFPVLFQMDALINASTAGGAVGANVFVRPPAGVTLSSLTLSPSTAGGGTAVTGTVTFSGPVPPSAFPAADGAWVSLQSSDLAVAALLPAVNVPSGAASATFSVSPRAVPTPRTVTITASYDATTLSAPLTVNAAPPVSLTSLALNQTSLSGGQGTVGFVNLSAPAPAGGIVVALSSTNPAVARVDANVFISAGGTGSSPFAVTTKAVAAATAVTISGSYGSATTSAVLTLTPAVNNVWLMSVALSPASVAGGSPSTGTVTLSGPAPAGGAAVTLSSTNAAAATVPASVTVPAGALSANFTATTGGVAASAQVKIFGLLNTTLGAVLTVTAPPTPPPVPAAPALLSPAVDANVAQPITFDWTDVSAALSYNIQIDDSSSFTTPLVLSQTVTVSRFTTGSLPVQRLWWRVRGINSAGVAGAFSAARRFQAQAAPPPPSAPSLSTLTVNPMSVVGGNSSQGTVTLTSGAPAGGAVVTLSSSSPSIASVPASVALAAGATSANFTITTASVTASNSATITASFGGTTRTAILTVTPPAPPPPPASLSALTLSPASVTGGNSSQGMVTLTSAAPTGGAVVTLSSSNINAATVPASVTLAAGVTSTTFTVTTKTVTASTPVTLSASQGGVTKTAVLTVTPIQTDTVAIQLAEYASPQLKVEATSTSSSATLQVFVTSSNALIGTLTNKGGGKYEGQPSWPVNPVNITVRSSLGGSATRTVTLK